MNEHDFHLSCHGTISVLTPITTSAFAWAEEHLPVDAMRWGANGTVIEHRYVGDIVEGIEADGLRVRRS